MSRKGVAAAWSPGFEISITFGSPVGEAIYHMLTCQLSLSEYAKGIGNETEESQGTSHNVWHFVLHSPLVEWLY